MKARCFICRGPPGISAKNVAVINYSLFFHLFCRSYSYLYVSTQKQRPLLPTSGHVILTQALPSGMPAVILTVRVRDRERGGGANFHTIRPPVLVNFQFYFSELKTRMLVQEAK